MKISACWIVKNEEANLRRSIESVADVADELIVVDTGSTDGTIALAESYGARVERFEWINDFSAARNYALSFAGGDLFIFLDADEWFVPKLGAEHRELIEKSFMRDPRLDAIRIQLKNISDATGQVSSYSAVYRIFRDPKRRRYSGRIHEVIEDAKTHIEYPEHFCIHHTGYCLEMLPAKLDRNIKMLESAADSSPKGSDERISHLIYLTREWSVRRNTENAVRCLNELMEHPKAFARVLSKLSDEIMSCVYAMLDAAYIERDSISRRDIRRKLVAMIQAARPDYPGSAVIDLLYQARFDLKEDIYLRDIGPALREAAEKPATTVMHYKKYQAYINETAAVALWRRGDLRGAFEYALNAARSTKKDVPCLAILLRAVKGQPTADIILFLNSVLNVSDPLIYKALTDALRTGGFRDVFAYYVKNRRLQAPVDAEDYLTLLMIYKKYDKLAEFAANAYAQGNTEAALYLFAAAICGAPPELTQRHAGILGEYEKFLRAYQNRERLADITGQDVQMLSKLHGLIAFADGIETAGRYLEIFRRAPRLCYLTNAAYCEINDLYERILHERMDEIDPFDFPCYRYKIQALISVSRYGEALREIARFFEKEIVEQELLHMLLVVAEKAPGEIGDKARRLYNPYIELYDALIDLGDVANTGVVPDGGSAKLKKAYKSMTRAKFDKHIAEGAGCAVTSKLLVLYRKAAEACKAKGFHEEAARCLCRLVASGLAERDDYEALASLFSTLGNAALPGYVRTLWRESIS